MDQKEKMVLLELTVNQDLEVCCMFTFAYIFFFLLVQAAPEHNLIHRPFKIYHFQDQQDLKENKEMDSRDNVDWTVKEEMKDQKE